MKIADPRCGAAAVLASVPPARATSVRLSHISGLLVGLMICLWGGLPSRAGVIVTSTVNPADLQAALNPTGLTIDAVTVVTGDPAQFGTYTNFTSGRVTIGDGVVLSSGRVVDVVPPPDPTLDSPAQSTDMGTPGTAEFDAFGSGINPITGLSRIENFSSSNDAAVLKVDFTLASDSQVLFDFVFGSVEFPFWTSQFTDSFLVFLDSTDVGSQITQDANGQPVQVGISFNNLVTLADQNTAFADPHGMLQLTTTTASLSAGSHTLWFEVADVNDHILDSAVFIANLRSGSGNEGTDFGDPDDDDIYEPFEPNVVPEPAAMSLWALGFASLVLMQWRSAFKLRPGPHGVAGARPSRS